MASEQRVFLVFILVLVLNGIESCFQSNENQNLNIVSGSSFYRECQCDDGYTSDYLQWFDNHNKPIPLLMLGPGTKPNMFVEDQRDSLNLYIQSFPKTMSGVYKCVAQVNGQMYTRSYTVEAYDPLYFYQTPNTQSIVQGRSSYVVCQPRSDSRIRVTWQKKKNEKEEAIYIFDDEKYVSEPNRLVIHNVTEDDAGTYICTAQVIATNEGVDKFISVQVDTVPEIKRIKASPDDYNPTRVVAGNYLTLECIADGMPHPEYLWNKTFEEGPTQSNITWRQKINTLVFDEIKPEDSGVYTCFAINSAGISTKSIVVEVLLPPDITHFSNITAIEHSTIQLSCNATGKPQPDISIVYEGRALIDDPNELFFNYEPKPNFYMMEVSRDKEGIYVCNASNEVTSVQTPMYLTVLHQPYFKEKNETIWGWEGKTVNLTCDQDSNPPATINWRFFGSNILTYEEVDVNKRLLITLNEMSEPYLTLTLDNDTAYGDYVCTATNMYGEAAKRITLLKGFTPGRVKNITLEDKTATSLTFNIVGPDHNVGPEVIGFTATYDEETNFSITDIHPNRTWAIGRSFKLDKLKPQTKYLVRFAALNEVGAGTFTEYEEFATLDKSVPEPPVWEEQPVTLERNSHVLRWRASDDNGEPIDFYTLTYCSEKDESCKTVQVFEENNVTELELEDLEFNTTYFLELVAHNSEGDSMPANISIIVPVPLLDAPSSQLSSGAVIGVSIVIVVVCLLLLDVLLLVWRRQGIIATCCFKKDNKRKESPLNSRDKKGLLTNGEPEDRGSARDNGHKEFQYNKSTGVVTGKHSAV